MNSFVTTVSESVSVGPRIESRQHPLTNLAQVEDAVKRLDGKTRSELVLEGQDDTVMIIGGGDKQRYVVSIAVNVDEQFFELQRADSRGDQQSEKVQLVTGGQMSTYDADRVVDLATATRAALAFVRDGKPDPALRWQEG